MNRIGPDQGTGYATGDEDRPGEPKKTATKTKKRKKKFNPTGYPASRPMHKEVSLLAREMRGRHMAVDG